jgi:hypothetical protein
MTWQRIDENTYIDDTLVTCAEYQLFIDEMREQGKYYQPDHWTSYQFSAGQALEAILGVRYSDAKAFCEWLTQREAAEWLYRLPIIGEANQCILYLSADQLAGYWLTYLLNELHHIDEKLFVWVNDNSINLRVLYQSVYDQILQLNGFDLGQTNYDAVDIDQAKTANQRIDSFDQQGVLDHFLRQFLNRSPDNSFSSREASLRQGFQRACKNYETLTKFIQNKNNVAYEQLYSGYQQRSKDILIEIYIMQERINGRFPAFEGIRLVKERVS